MKKILVINPNSSPTTTKAIEVLLQDLITQDHTSILIETYTAPSGPPSIDNDDDALMSAKAVMADLQFKLSEYDAYLVACYSLHPLVAMLKAVVPARTHVTGVFEASLSFALSLLPLDKQAKFGIIGTDSFWETALTEGVHQYLGSKGQSNARFKGIEIIGLGAAELRSTDQAEVNQQVKRATKALIQDRSLRVICLGWVARYPGLSDVVGDAIREELGNKAESIYIVDGLEAGIQLLQALIEIFPVKQPSVTGNESSS